MLEIAVPSREEFRFEYLVLDLNGTLSGEHGVGLAKRDFVDREIDPIALRLMRDIKRQFDPGDILNPGKTLPERNLGKL